eukprot:211975_1
MKMMKSIGNWLLIFIALSSITDGMTFDHVTSEFYDSKTISIGWKKMMSCSKGASPLFTYSYSNSEIQNYASTAISLKFTPSTGDDNDYTLIAKPETNLIKALNMFKEVSYSVNDAGNWIGQSNANDWIGSVTAKSRLGSKCGTAPLRDFSEAIYHGACLGTIHILPGIHKTCQWGAVPNNDIDIYFGYPASMAEKESNDICTFPECTSDVALDIIFLMDESGSIGENEWQTMVSFVKRVIRDDINDASYVSLVEYGSISDFNVFGRFSRATQANKQTLLNALDNNVFSSTGYTYTADAITKTLPLFADGSDTRRDLLFLLTDGVPTDQICPDLEVAVRNSAVEIVVIGIGSDDGLDELTWTNSIDCVCDVGTNAFFVEEFSTKEFNRIEADLRGKTCTYTQQANALSFESKFLPDSSPSYLSGSQNENKIIKILYEISLVLFVSLVFSWFGMLFACLKLKRYKEVNMYSKAHQNDSI